MGLYEAHCARTQRSIYRARLKVNCMKKVLDLNQPTHPYSTAAQTHQFVVLIKSGCECFAKFKYLADKVDPISQTSHKGLNKSSHHLYVNTLVQAISPSCTAWLSLVLPATMSLIVCKKRDEYPHYKASCLSWFFKESKREVKKLSFVMDSALLLSYLGQQCLVAIVQELAISPFFGRVIPGSLVASLAGWCAEIR